MVEIIWEFLVKPEARGQFELAYGPGGAWSILFARSPGFRGITVLRDTQNPWRYLMIEVWDTEAQRKQALAERPAEYTNLEETLEEWIETKTEVGVFEMLAEATVRPRGKAGRIKGGEPGRSSGWKTH